MPCENVSAETSGSDDWCVPFEGVHGKRGNLACIADEKAIRSCQFHRLGSNVLSSHVRTHALALARSTWAVQEDAKSHQSDSGFLFSESLTLLSSYTSVAI